MGTCKYSTNRKNFTGTLNVFRESSLRDSLSAKVKTDTGEEFYYYRAPRIFENLIIDGLKNVVDIKFTANEDGSNPRDAVLIGEPRNPKESKKAKNIIEQFQKEAKELNRDINSVEEFKMWLQAAEDWIDTFKVDLDHNIRAEIKAIEDYGKFIDDAKYFHSSGRFTDEELKVITDHLEEIKKDEEDHLAILEKFKLIMDQDESLLLLREVGD